MFESIVDIIYLQ